MAESSVLCAQYTESVYVHTDASAAVRLPVPFGRTFISGLFAVLQLQALYGNFRPSIVAALTKSTFPFRHSHIGYFLVLFLGCAALTS